MPFTSLTKSELQESLQRATADNSTPKAVRMLFAPTKIETNQVDDFTSIYKNLAGDTFDTLVVIESYTGELEKKLSLPSNSSFETPFGIVEVNDKLRDELCDEEDDFYISDSGMSDSVSLYTQLMMFQAYQEKFDVVSVQIGDYDTAIVKELAYALDELLNNRNALLVFCCDIPSANKDELAALKALIERNNESALHHYINSNQKKVNGARALITGVMVARSWGLDIQFMDEDNNSKFIGGFAYVPKHQLA